MSVFPANQPIIFEPYLPDSCNCNDDTFRLLAKREDYCQFQVIVGACDNTESVICNADFDPAESVECLGSNWVLTGGFSIDTHAACCSDATGTITQYGVLIVGTPYEISINVSSVIGTLYIYNGATQVAEINEIGITTFVFAATSDDLSMVIQNADHSVCVATISAKPLSLNMAFGVINSAGNTLDVETYAAAPSFFTFAQNTVTITFPWSHFDIEDGQCYTIGFADGCSNLNGQFGVANGDFLNCLSNWQVNMGTLETITCEDLENPETGDVEPCIEFTNSGTGSITNYATILKVGLSYQVTVDAMSDDADGVIRVYCGTAFADFTTAATQTIVCTGNTAFKIEAITNTATYVRLWGVSIELSNSTYTEFDYESYAFKIGENQCTHLINLSNDDDGMGFVFVGSGFAPQIRLESEIINSVAEIIRESYHDNQGKKEVFFGEYRKRFIFNIDYVPAWVFDFLCVCFIADHFFIDGVEYFIEGDTVETNYPENVCYSNMTSVRMEVSTKEQLVRNADIGNASQAITLAGTVYLTDGNGNIVVDAFTQTEITIR
jgi:hypothetical protein